MAAAAAAAQPVSPASPSFGSGVEQVVVDVVVLDEHGAPVSGLGKDDLVLLEDGTPQQIATFQAVHHGATAGPAAPPRPFAAEPATPSTSRTFVLLLDDLALTRPQGERAKSALAELARGAGPADTVLLLSTSRSERWVARSPEERGDLLAVLERLQGRFVETSGPETVSDAEAYRIEVEEGGTAVDGPTLQRVVDRYLALGVLPDIVPAVRDVLRLLAITNARRTYQRASSRVDALLGVLEEAVAATALAPGRKSIVLASPGFFYQASAPGYRRVLEACRRANAVVHFLDVAGLEALPPALTAQGAKPAAIPQAGKQMTESEADFAGAMSAHFSGARDKAAGAVLVANETGGVVATDLTRGVSWIERDSRAYYLLGYVPTNTAMDGSFRRIAVSVAAGDGARDRHGWQVRARRGYHATAPARAAPASAEQAIAGALDSAVDGHELPVRLAARILEDSTRSPGRVHCRLVAEVDTAAVGFREQQGRSLARLQALFATRARDGREETRVGKKAELKLRPATRARLGRDGYRLEHDLELPAGIHQARVAVRDEAGRIGTATARIDVPATGSFRRSSGVLSDALANDPRGQPSPVPTARREFDAGSRLYLAFDVYGAAPDPGSGRPRVTMGYQVLKPDGTVALEGTPSPMTVDEDGIFHRLVGFDLGRTAPGDYRIVTRLTDDVSGREIRATDAFSVRAEPEGPVPPTAGDTRLEAVLRRAGGYVVEYERVFADIVAEEEYAQRAPIEGRNQELPWRRTRAELVFTRLPGEAIPWASFRDVFELNGQPVRQRDGRLEKLFRDEPAHALERALAILAESARYNIGPERTVNLPTLALLFLHPENQQRFAFERRGESAEAVEVAFRERTRPTLVRERSLARARERGLDLPAEGRFWIDTRSGAVLRSEVQFRFRPYDDLARITTIYRHEPTFSAWLPSEMRERYEGAALFGGVTEAVARYSHFRRFGVTVDESGPRLPER